MGDSEEGTYLKIRINGRKTSHVADTKPSRTLEAVREAKQDGRILQVEFFPHRTGVVGRVIERPGRSKAKP
jgi:hypothetical protein